MGLLDMPTHYEQIASGARAKVAADFAKYGLELVDFFINAITPPDEVQQAIDARSSMGAVGDLNAFMKFQAAQSMAKMAQQGGGAARARDGHGHGRRLRDDDARHDPRRDDGRPCAASGPDGDAARSAAAATAGRTADDAARHDVARVAATRQAPPADPILMI